MGRKIDKGLHPAIINRHLSGESCSSIGVSMGISRSTIRYILNSNGIYGRPGRSKHGPDVIAKMIDLYAELGSVWKVAAELGVSGQQVHARLRRLGVAKPMNLFSKEDEAVLIAEYRDHADRWKLEDLAKRLGRTVQFLNRKAKALGLTDSSRDRSYKADRQAVSTRIKKWLKENEHPRGMLGKSHGPESLSKISAASKRKWMRMTSKEKAEKTDKMLRSRAKNHGTLVPNNRGSASWKAGWREIGGKKKYYRSRWEANYARYLEWMKGMGQIKDWLHEPDTFWFDGIKRGVRSYLPDFKVTHNDDSFSYHEVKGWMDPASKTKLKRMKKYHPNIKIELIDSKRYNALSKQVGSIVPGWEK